MYLFNKYKNDMWVLGKYEFSRINLNLEYNYVVYFMIITTLVLNKFSLCTRTVKYKML